MRLLVHLLIRQPFQSKVVPNEVRVEVIRLGRVLLPDHAVYLIHGLTVLITIEPKMKGY